MTHSNNRWPLVPISEVYIGLYDGPHATPPAANSGPIFLGIGNLTDDGHFDLSSVRHISEKDFPRWTKRVLPQPGDIVFTYEATLNRYAIIPNGFKGCLGRRLALIRPNPAKVNYRFLYYYFFSKEWRATIDRNRLSGATVDRIPISKFPTFPIRLPPLRVQHWIASALSAYDDLIENNTRRIAILEEMARRLFEHWFVEFEFPGARGLRCVDTEIGATPEGWEVAPVKAVVAFDPPTPVAKSGEKPFVPMAALSTSSMVIDGVERRGGNSGSKFRNGDTLLARITPCLENGKTGYVAFLEDGETAFGSTEFIVLRGRRVSPEFVYLLARSARFREHAIKSMSGATGRQRVRSDNLQDLKIAVPPPNIDTAFRDIARPMFRLIHTLHEANRRLRAARDLLLPKLISGEIEVGAAPIPEAAAAE